MTIIRFDLSSAPRISLEEAQRSYEQAKAVFVDVRSKTEYEKAHIPGAIAVPFKEFPQRMRELPQDKEIITY